MDIVSYARKLKEIIDHYQLDASLETSPEELEKAIKLKEDEARLLKIGIVGRVKAGKSSLLNAIFFDGKDILPKAATPMTAALTILEYGKDNKTKAIIDFFTEEDISNIKKEHDKFEQKLNLKFQELREKQHTKTPKKILSEEELWKKAFRNVKNDSNIKLQSSYEQYEKIKNRTIDIQNEQTEFEANNIEELKEKLVEYIGADGKYMPLTKSVTLKLPEESLKDIQIIDTPGVNDPVVSREERTRQLLKFCDVIFVLSHSGQFMNKEDTDLLDRITRKEGIGKLFAIASQVDNQLYGSIRRDSNGDLHIALQNIKSKLFITLKNALVSLKQQHPEVANAYEDLMKKENLITASAMAFKIKKRFDEKEKFSDMKTVWQNLVANYPDYFSNEDTAISNLENLANIEEVNKAINKVKEKKQEILKNAKEQYIKGKLNDLNEDKEKIIEKIKEDISKVKDADLDKLKNQRDELLKKKEELIPALNNIFNGLIKDFEINLREKLYHNIKSYFKNAREGVKSEEQEQTESYEVSVSKWYNPFSWGKTETRYDHYTTVRAGAVRNILEELTEKLEDIISIEAEKYKIVWRKNLHKQFTSEIRQIIGDQNIDIQYLSRILNNITMKLEMPEITYTGSLPSSLKKSGVLERYEAEEFIEEAGNYVSSLRTRVRNDVKRYIEQIVKALQKEKIGEMFFEQYEQKLIELEKNIKNKELSLDRFKKILKELEELKWNN